MFNIFTDSVENALDVMGGLIEGEIPTSRQVAELVDAGVSLYSISEATGVAVDVLEKILED